MRVLVAYFLFLFITCFSLGGNAQVVNPDLEDWVWDPYYTPEGWSVMSDLVPDIDAALVSQKVPQFNGNAIQLLNKKIKNPEPGLPDSIEVSGYMMQSGIISYRPPHLYFSYIWESQSREDRALVYCVAQHRDTTATDTISINIGTATFEISEMTGGWTFLEKIPIIYTRPEEMNGFVIYAFNNLDPSKRDLSSKATVDHFQFIPGPVGVEEHLNLEAEEAESYILFDYLGRIQYQGRQNPLSNSQQFNSGVYILHYQFPSGAVSRKKVFLQGKS